MENKAALGVEKSYFFRPESSGSWNTAQHRAAARDQIAATESGKASTA